ncbi:MAG: uracil-DNA glycosylase [Candidatus Omnitrophica bacterium]|nr:uracil-DNA glycosylase [Candidatus Omnitrophota bacterium]
MVRVKGTFSKQKELRQLVQAAKQQAKLLEVSSVESLPRRRGTWRRGTWPCAPTLDDLRQKVLGCTLCDLHRGRTHAVFGEGNPKAALMFIGEGPGREEDRQGRPFVGMAGQLLTKIIESIQFRREEVYIANIVKCRPPENRVPFPLEIAACRPYLISQIEQIRPRVICALGKTAAWALLNTEIPISQLRGKWFEFGGVRLMPTFHPAYLLRNPQDKRLVWEDMKKIRQELGSHKK